MNHKVSTKTDKAMNNRTVDINNSIDAIVNIKGGNPDGRSKYFLNNDATVRRLKKGAMDKDLLTVCNKDDSFTITFSAGAYISVVLQLLKFLMENDD